jgi:hypothetical protein
MKSTVKLRNKYGYFKQIAKTIPTFGKSRDILLKQFCILYIYIYIYISICTILFLLICFIVLRVRTRAGKCPAAPLEIFLYLAGNFFVHNLF